MGALSLHAGPVKLWARGAPSPKAWTARSGLWGPDQLEEGSAAGMGWRGALFG